MDEITEDKIELKQVVIETPVSKSHVSGQATTDGVEQPLQLSPGQIVAERYRVISLVGEGGMGSVYRVEQMFLRRDFALKTLNPQNMSDISWRRFQKEAQAAGALDHPSLIKVHDFGTIDDRQPFFVMDFFDGETLAQRLKATGPLPLEQTLDIFIHACFALAYAHKQGVVHRDIKPSNIMVSRVDFADQEVRIVDFGIAKLINTEEAETLALTRTGEIFGTPYYMSPEQCLGSNLDRRADVYSVGCVMFEMLTGLPPFIGDTAISILLQHQSALPPSLKEATLGKSFPEPVERVIRKLLEKKPEDRYQDLLDVASDLERIKMGQRIEVTGQQTKSQRALAAQNEARTARAHLATIILSSLIVSLIAFMAGRFSAPVDKKAETAPVAPPAVDRHISTTPLPLPGYFSTSADPHTRHFRFPDGQDVSPGTILLPKGVQAFAALPEVVRGDRVDAIGDITFDNFKPLVLNVGIGTCVNPLVLRGFRPDEVSELHFRDANFTKVNIHHLENSAHLTGVKTIDIADSATMNNEVLPYIDAFPQLVELNVGRTRVTAAGVLGLKRFAKLSSLNLRSIADGNTVALRLHNSTVIRRLSLRKARMQDNDVALLGTLPNLTFLDLSGNQELTDKAVAELIKMKNLQELSLHECKLSAASIPFLKQLPSLKILTISTDSWAQADKDILVQSLPNCQINYRRIGGLFD